MLLVGYNAGSQGTYTLGGTGNLLAASEAIGSNGGVGTFTQSGGANSVSTLTVGDANYLGVYGTGTYNLNGGILSANSLSVGWCQFYNTPGTGIFTQSAGTNSVGWMLYLGEYQNTGIYNLSGGSAYSPNDYIGYWGNGNFVQSGGTNTTGILYLGYYSGSQGTYDLKGGMLIATSILGGSGAAAFNFGGGTLCANDNLST